MEVNFHSNITFWNARIRKGYKYKSYEPWRHASFSRWRGGSGKITIWINIVFMLNTNENKQYVWLFFLGFFQKQLILY